MAEKMIQMVGEDEEGYVSFPAFFRIYLDVHHQVHSLHPLCACAIAHILWPTRRLPCIIIMIINNIDNMYTMPASPQH